MKRRGGVLAIACVVLSGCAVFRPAPVPMRSLEYPRDPGKTQPCLIVMLPERGDVPESFEQHGFIRSLRERSIAAVLAIT